MKKRQQNPRKIQERALKKRTQRKHRLTQQKDQSGGSGSPVHHIRQARTYPIEGCWAQRGWMEHGLAVVAVARRQQEGLVAFGTYLVDYYCLGLKDTAYNANIPPARFHNEFLPRIYRGEPPMEISTELAHEIVHGGIEYAEQYGFRPHKDFRTSQYILDPPEEHPRTGRVEFGKDGKPLYISGPNDNVEQIMRQLVRTAGEGNFHFLAHLGEVPDYLVDEEGDLEYVEDEGDDEQSHSLLWVPGANEEEKEDGDDQWERGSRSSLWIPR